MKTCNTCEFYFEVDDDRKQYRCAGGSRIVEGKQEEGYFKNYGDILKKGEEKIKHNCEGWHQGWFYNLTK